MKDGATDKNYSKYVCKCGPALCSIAIINPRRNETALAYLHYTGTMRHTQIFRNLQGAR